MNRSAIDLWVGVFVAAGFGMYLNRRHKVKQEGERRSVFLRYLGEVASAVGVLHEYDDKKRTEVYEKLLAIAKRKTAEADTKFDDRGRKKVDENEEDFGDNVLIVSQDEPTADA